MFAARKTAGISGDIRKAFQVCRVAAENALVSLEKSGDNLKSFSPSQPIIKMSDIQSSSREMFNSKLAAAVRNATPFEALIFVALASLKRHLGADRKLLIIEVLEKIEGMANALGQNQYLPVPTFGELIDMLNRLAEVSYRHYLLCFLIMSIGI